MGDLQIFSPDKLRETVQRALDQPDVDLTDKRGAFVLVADQDGVKAVTAMRVNDVWTIQAAVEQPWKGQPTIGATVKATW